MDAEVFVDAVLTAAFQSAPQLGAIGGFVWLVLLLLRRESSSEDRHAAEMARIKAHHEADLKRVKDDLAESDKGLDELNKKYDDERKLRRELEEQLAAAKRGSPT